MNPNITLVTSKPNNKIRLLEPGGKRLSLQVESNTFAFQEICNNLSRFGYNGKIDLLTYEDSFVPRHFLLKVDDSIFTGSYLSHKKGEHSYLLKIKNRNDHLYALFQSELEHVLSRTEKISTIN